jgi:Asp-tRNA(Asn)/Glu-tRNA(Gln) amidotransferase A subunit family amidase
MVPLALGSQTAGSTIRPASYCGIYGFKPSFGLVPRTGMLKTTDTLDHVSFFARNIEDLRLIFDLARVRGSNHPVVQQRVDPAAEAPAPSQWRVGFVRGPKWEEARPYAREALERFAGALASVRGVSVADVGLPPDFSRIHEIHQRIYCRMLAYYFKAENRTPDALSESFRSMAREGAKVGPAEYRDCLDFQARATRDLDRHFEEKAVDLLLTLSTGSEAPLGLGGRDLPDNCLIWTFCGVPALSIPAFTSSSGLPFGAQLVGRKYGDYPLLRFTRLLVREELLEEKSPSMWIGQMEGVG